MTLRIVPVNQDQANAFIAAWHRHHRPPLGYRFALGVASTNGGGEVMTAHLVGVATVGRPVSRHLDDGATVEVTRVATDGTRNACSALYGACWRAARAIGYDRAVTYTRDDESGESLRAAGWLRWERRASRRGWDTPSRRRDNRIYDAVDRWLWFVETSRAPLPPLTVSAPVVEADPALFELPAVVA